MKDMLEKMMNSDESSKSKSAMSDMEKQAKMDVLMELLELAQSEMGNRVKSGMGEMQKVTIAAPDEKSLLAGLEKAEDVVEEKAMPEMEDEESEDESEEKELNLSEGGLIVNNDNHPLTDEKTKEAMDSNFTTKADSNPVADDEDEDMFSKKKTKRSANRALYLGDDE